MNSQPVEVIYAYFMAAGFWLLVLVVIFALSRSNQKAFRFKTKMLRNWKPASLIALFYLAGSLIKGGNLHSFWNGAGAIGIFCQSLLGITMARSMANYEPLPVMMAIKQHHRLWRKIGLMFGVGILSVFPVLLIGTIGLSICRGLFGEVYHPAAVLHALLPDKWLAFFAFFSGAGIAEETTFRLVLVAFLWQWTRNRRLAIILAALFFGLYHLSPLDSMYRTFWQFPISQLISSSLIGIVWGYLYLKRGYETVVLAHTLSDWLPFLFF